MVWTSAPHTDLTEVQPGLHEGPPTSGAGAVPELSLDLLSVGPVPLTGPPCVASVGRMHLVLQCLDVRRVRGGVGWLGGVLVVALLRGEGEG